MRPKEDIEKFVKDNKPRVTTGRRMDKRTLNDSFAAMEQTILAKSTKTRGPVIIIRSRTARLMAAAAIVIVAIGLFLGRNFQRPGEPGAVPRQTAQSSVKKMSLISMRMTYQRGGLDALDRQLRDTLELTRPQPLSISIQELLEGVNGS
jgi:hypothetical protein